MNDNSNNTLFELDSDSDIKGMEEYYENLMRGGLSKKAAKQLVYERYPTYVERVMMEGTSERGHWGNAIGRVEKKLAKEKLSKDRTAKEKSPEEKKAESDDTLAVGKPCDSAAAFTRHMFARWCERNDPQVGDEFVFSPYQYVDVYEAMTGKRVSTAAFANEFLVSQNLALIKAGWQFATSGSYECYKVKIALMPQPPEPEPVEIPAPAADRTYTEDEVRKLLADFADRFFGQFGNEHG